MQNTDGCVVVVIAQSDIHLVVVSLSGPIWAAVSSDGARSKGADSRIRGFWNIVTL